MRSKEPTKSKTTRQRSTRHTEAAVPPPSVSEALHTQIATRAYELYERRIRQGPLDDWLQAEEEILGQVNTRQAEKPHRGGYATEEQN